MGLKNRGIMKLQFRSRVLINEVITSDIKGAE